jgi:hypothetical protein
VTSGIVVAILSWFWYHELFDKVLSGFEDSTPALMRSYK